MTILGKHTVHELQDLLAAYDYQQGELERAAAAAAPSWQAADAAGHEAWAGDYNAWRARYTPVRASALSSTQGLFVIVDIDTREDQYQALAAAFLPLADLDRRMRQAPSAAAHAPDYAQNPQPTAPDQDLGQYKAIDAGIRSMPAPVKSVLDRIAAAAGVGRGTADADNRPFTAPSPATLWGLGALAALALLVAAKVLK